MRENDVRSWWNLPRYHGIMIQLWDVHWCPAQKYTISGWWFQPLWKILVTWDEYSQYMEKQHVPNHQPDIITGVNYIIKLWHKYTIVIHPVLSSYDWKFVFNVFHSWWDLVSKYSHSWWTMIGPERGIVLKLGGILILFGMIPQILTIVYGKW